MLNRILQPFSTNKTLLPIKVGFILLLIFAVINLTVGIYQATGSTGDLNLAHMQNKATLFTPEIYNDKNNEYNIRYPINSAIIMSPIFAFYTLDSSLLYYYLLLMIAALITLPKLLIHNTRINIDTHRTSYLIIILTILIATAATRVALHVGQFGIILFTLFLLSEKIAKNNPLLAAIILAIAISKPQIGIFFLIFMLLNRYYLTSLLAASIHLIAYILFCYLNDLNFISTIVRWVDWQMQFPSHAMNEEIGHLINSMHSIDIFNITRTLNLPNGIVIASFIVIFIAGPTLLYKCRDNRHAQLAVLCIWPLLLFYHRPYDFFLMWGIIPLLLQNRDNSGMYALMKLVVIIIMLLPYIPNFGMFTDYVSLRKTFYFVYAGMTLFVLISIYLFSRRNHSAGYT